jgi:hypothetical protein
MGRPGLAVLASAGHRMIALVEVPLKFQGPPVGASASRRVIQSLK